MGIGMVIKPIPAFFRFPMYAENILEIIILSINTYSRTCVFSHQLLLNGIIKESSKQNRFFWTKSSKNGGSTSLTFVCAGGVGKREIKNYVIDKLFKKHLNKDNLLILI